MPSRESAFFSFMLGWSLIAGRLTGMPFPLIMIPILWIVSGKRYVLYFFLLNMIVSLPNMINMVTLGISYMQIMSPVLHTVSQISDAPTQTLKSQLALNFTKGIIGYGNLTSTSLLQSQYILWTNPMIISAGILGMPVLIYLYVKTIKKILKMYLKMWHMVRTVIRHGNIIRSKRTT